MSISININVPSVAPISCNSLLTASTRTTEFTTSGEYTLIDAAFSFVLHAWAMIGLVSIELIGDLHIDNIVRLFRALCPLRARYSILWKQLVTGWQILSLVEGELQAGALLERSAVVYQG